MAKPDVHGQPPSGENAGAALSDNGPGKGAGVEEAKVKEIRDADRGNPSGDGSGSPAWMSVLEDLLRVGGKELFNVTKDYVREGNLSLFSRRNPEPENTGQEDGGQEAPSVPPPEHFQSRGDGESGSSGVSEGARSESSSRNSGQEPDDKDGSDPDSPTSAPTPNVKNLSPGDLARLEVGNSVVWVEVVGTATGSDDYEGRMASAALGLGEGAPVTFSKRHLLGRVEEAPKNPEPGPPEGIAGKRTRDNPGGQDGPLPPRF